MKITINKLYVLDVVLLVLSIGQLLLGMTNLYFPSEYLNVFSYYTNYILLFLIVILLAKKGIAKNFLAISFYVCFFIFLMGQKIFEESYHIYLTFVLTNLDVAEYSIFTFILSSAIILTYYGYVSGKKRIVTNEINYPRAILPIIRWGFFITLPAALYMQLKIVLVRSAISYTAGYTINVAIPTPIKILTYLFLVFLFLYLAFRPSKTEVYFLLSTFLFIEGGVQLIQGRRALFATTLLFVIWYIIQYFEIKKLKLRYLIGLLTVAFMMIILFFIVEQYRNQTSIGGHSVAMMIRKFMISTGGSDSVIANTIQKKALFPKNPWLYLIDPIVNNPIAVILMGKGGNAQGYAYLENFNSFSHWLSYLSQPILYLSGHGMGSSYLAEVYLVSGIPGVMVVSVFLGRFIKWLSEFQFDSNIFKTALIFLFVKNLFTLPRDSFFSWFGDFSYLLVGFLSVYLFYYRYYIQRVR